MVANGVATLGPTPLFPDGTRYYVSTPVGYGFANGAALSGAAAVPEPSSWAMMLIGFSALGVAMRSRRNQAAARAG